MFLGKPFTVSKLVTNLFMTGPKLHRFVREFWRILEVYLFFIVSVLGCTALGNAPSYSSKSKDRNSSQKFEKRLPTQTRAGLIAPPEFLSIGHWNVTEGRSHISNQKESSGDDEASAALSASKDRHFANASNSPFLSPIEFYHHILNHTSGTFHHLEATTPDLSPKQILTPLLI